MVGSIPPPILSVIPVRKSHPDVDLFESAITTPFPISVVTHSQAKKAKGESEKALDSFEQTFHIAGLFQSPGPNCESLPVAEARVVSGRRALIAARKADDCAA